MQLIRTLSHIKVKIKISINELIPLYQKLAPKIRKLKALGMTNVEIATKLQVTRKTVWKGLKI